MVRKKAWELPANNDRLYQTVAEVLGVPFDSLFEETSPDFIPSWDSLNHLNLVMALESEFGVSLSAEDVLDMRNMALIRTVLRGYGVDV